MARYSSGSGGGGFDYVQSGTPSAAEEGEEWYATGEGTYSKGAYVFDGQYWIEQTVVEHGQLSGVQSDQHHSPPTQTQNSDGWETIDTDLRIDGGTTESFFPSVYADTISLKNINGYGNSGGYTVYCADGTTFTGTLNDGETTQISLGPRWVTRIKAPDVVFQVYRTRCRTAGNHSHSI